MDQQGATHRLEIVELLRLNSEKTVRKKKPHAEGQLSTILGNVLRPLAFELVIRKGAQRLQILENFPNRRGRELVNSEFFANVLVLKQFIRNFLSDKAAANSK